MFKCFSLVLISLLFFSCANPWARDNEEQETQQQATLEEVVQIKTMYCNSQQTIYDLLETHRCDKITFKAMYVAFCGRGSINDHYDDGAWSRDTQACMQDLNGDGRDDSRSECSGDGIILASHVWLTDSNQAQAARTVQHLEDNDWVCGPGFTGYTKVGKLKWLTRTVRDHLEGDTKPTPADVAAAIAASGMVDLGDLLKEFNKYLVAFHAYSFGRMNHAFSDATMDILRDFVNSSPGSMIFQALYNRYLEGDQQTALDIIKAECPVDRVPTEIGFAGWGSSLKALHCIAAISILEGV